GYRTMPLDREGELLVLGADAELRSRLAALLEPRDKLVARVERRHVDLIAGHRVPSGKKGGDLTHGIEERAMTRCRPAGGTAGADNAPAADGGAGRWRCSCGAACLVLPPERRNFARIEG